MTYKVTIIYADNSTEIVRGIPSMNFFSNSFMFYNERRGSSCYRDGFDISSVHIVPEVHGDVQNYLKSKNKKHKEVIL